MNPQRLIPRYADGAAAGLGVTPWAGGLAWALEVRRLASVMQCRTTHFDRWDATIRQLTLWRLRSPAQCNQAAIEAILPLLEAAKRSPTNGFGLDWLDHPVPWTRAELGELLVIARNRAALYALGRDRPKPKGPRLDPSRLPDDRLDALIQRHRDLDLVDRLRAERNRRLQELTA